MNKSMRQRLVSGVVCVAFFAVSVLGGCTHTAIISTTPPGAQVKIDGLDVGSTDLNYIENTGWKKVYMVEISKPGYRTKQVQLSQTEWNSGELAAWIIPGLFVWPMLIGIGKTRQLKDNYHFELEPEK